MKKKAYQDLWKRLQAASHPVRIDLIEFKDVHRIGSPSIQLENGNIFFFCGVNGSGKSTLLSCVYSAMTDGEEGGPMGSSAPVLPIDSHGSVHVQGNNMNSQIDISYSLHNKERTGLPLENVFYLEPSAMAPQALQLLKETDDLDELVNSNGQRSFAVEDFNYAVGREYERISVTEIEFFSGIIPYFYVEADGTAYSALEMGLGEYCVFHLLWLLDYLPKNSIVLIEEPEAFLPPRSQSAVADVIAKQCAEKQLFAVVATHSPSVLCQSPNSSIRVLIREGGNCRLLESSAKDEHLSALGILSPKEGIIFVEDLAAQHAVESMLYEHAQNISRRYSVVRKGGHSEVIDILKRLPKDGHRFKFIGILDGDQKAAGHQSHWPLFYLPDSTPPDQQMIEAVYRDTSVFTHSLGCSNKDSLSICISSVKGYDCHDWPHEFSKLSGIDLHQVFRAMATCWIRSESWRDEVISLCKEIGRTCA